MAKVIGIFTGKDLAWMESEGGSGYWIARSDRIRSAEYVVLIRNHRETWAIKDGVEHGQAFMVGKIAGCKDSQKYEGRKLIQISEYALLPNTEQFKKAWKKLTARERPVAQRYPVAYMDTDHLIEKLNLDVNDLEWSTFKANPNAESIKDNHLNDNEPSIIDKEKELSEIIAEAKEMIAEAAGTEPEKIDIRISF